LREITVDLSLSLCVWPVLVLPWFWNIDRDHGVDEVFFLLSCYWFLWQIFGFCICPMMMAMTLSDLLNGWMDRSDRIWTPRGHSFAFARSELPWMANAVSAPPSSGCRSMLGARVSCSLTLLTSGTALVADLWPPLLPPPIYWHCKCKSMGLGLISLSPCALARNHS
jgi:hypothetical protein